MSGEHPPNLSHRLRQVQRLLEHPGLDGVFGRDWATIDPDTGDLVFDRVTADRLQMVLWRLDALDEEQMARLTERRSRDRDEAEHQRRSAPVAAPSVPVDVLVGPHLGGQQ